MYHKDGHVLVWNFRIVCFYGIILLFIQLLDVNHTSIHVHKYKLHGWPLLWCWQLFNTRHSWRNSQAWYKCPWSWNMNEGNQNMSRVRWENMCENIPPRAAENPEHILIVCQIILGCKGLLGDWGHSVQIYVRYIDNIKTLYRLGRASGRLPDCTQYMCYTSRLKGIQ